MASTAWRPDACISAIVCRHDASDRRSTPLESTAEEILHDGSAVDVPRLARDVVALRRSEEERESRDVVGPRDPPGRRQAQDRGTGVALGERPLAARGRFAAARVDAARAD